MAKKPPPPPPRRSSTLAGFLAGAAVAAVALLVYFVVVRQDPAPEQLAPPLAAPPPATATGPQPRPIPPFTETEVAAAERITAEAARALQQNGQAVFIDVRDVESYRAAHIPAALQIPLFFVEGEIPFFPRDRKLIPYCT